MSLSPYIIGLIQSASGRGASPIAPSTAGSVPKPMSTGSLAGELVNFQTTTEYRLSNVNLDEVAATVAGGGQNQATALRSTAGQETPDFPGSYNTYQDYKDNGGTQSYSSWQRARDNWTAADRSGSAPMTDGPMTDDAAFGSGIDYGQAGDPSADIRPRQGDPGFLAQASFPTEASDLGMVKVHNAIVADDKDPSDFGVLEEYFKKVFPEEADFIGYMRGHLDPNYDSRIIGNNGERVGVQGSVTYATSEREAAAKQRLTDFEKWVDENHPERSEAAGTGGVDDPAEARLRASQAIRDTKAENMADRVARGKAYRKGLVETAQGTLGVLQDRFLASDRGVPQSVTDLLSGKRKPSEDPAEDKIVQDNDGSWIDNPLRVGALNKDEQLAVDTKNAKTELDDLTPDQQEEIQLLADDWWGTVDEARRKQFMRDIFRVPGGFTPGSEPLLSDSVLDSTVGRIRWDVLPRMVSTIPNFAAIITNRLAKFKDAGKTDGVDTDVTTDTTPPDGTDTTPPDGTDTTPPDGTDTTPPDGTDTTPPDATAAQGEDTIADENLDLTDDEVAKKEAARAILDGPGGSDTNLLWILRGLGREAQRVLGPYLWSRVINHRNPNVREEVLIIAEGSEGGPDIVGDGTPDGNVVTDDDYFDVDEKGKIIAKDGSDDADVVSENPDDPWEDDPDAPWGGGLAEGRLGTILIPPIDWGGDVAGQIIKAGESGGTATEEEKTGIWEWTKDALFGDEAKATVGKALWTGLFGLFSDEPDKLDELKLAYELEQAKIAQQNKNLGGMGGIKGFGKTKTKPIRDTSGNLIYDQTGGVAASRLSGRQGLISAAEGGTVASNVQRASVADRVAESNSAIESRRLKRRQGGLIGNASG